MTSPPDPNAMLSQILIKQGEMGVQLAVISEQLKAVPDHEARIRSLEKWRYGLPIAGLLAVASVAVSIWATLR